LDEEVKLIVVVDDEEGGSDRWMEDEGVLVLGSEVGKSEGEVRKEFIFFENHFGESVLQHAKTTTLVPSLFFFSIAASLFTALTALTASEGTLESFKQTYIVPTRCTLATHHTSVTYSCTTINT